MPASEMVAVGVAKLGAPGEDVGKVSRRRHASNEPSVFDTIPPAPYNRTRHQSRENIGMQLLVSVATGSEAMAAVAGGADIVDAKDPAAGALGAVELGALSEIRASLDGRPLTAALGDAIDPATVEHAARAYAACGASLVKIGFAGVRDSRDVAGLIGAAVRGCRQGSPGCGVVAVAYADATPGDGLDAMSLVRVAARTGAAGVLVDTANKHGPRLTDLWTASRLCVWVAEARGSGLLTALAGRLRLEDLSVVQDAGADVVGVRGAACEGGRTGTVSAERVRMLRDRLSPFATLGMTGSTRGGRARPRSR
jgi:uncharacterized protein (UPF0264 family)